MRNSQPRVLKRFLTPVFAQEMTHRLLKLNARSIPRGRGSTGVVYGLQLRFLQLAAYALQSHSMLTAVVTGGATTRPLSSTANNHRAFVGKLLSRREPRVCGGATWGRAIESTVRFKKNSSVRTATFRFAWSTGRLRCYKLRNKMRLVGWGVGRWCGGELRCDTALRATNFDLRRN
jgi:hypothetical protein